MNIFGLNISAARVRANMSTTRIVVRRNGRLLLLVGLSTDTEKRRKLFARTELRGGFKASIGRQKDPARIAHFSRA